MRRPSPLAAVAALLLAAAPAAGSSYGTLSNFDVVNDTTHPCHGFEIELEDLSPDDVPYAFGGDYIRYGAPEIVDATVDPAHPRVVVRYRFWTGSAWAATPVAPAGITPGGHDCYRSGPIGNYEASGCEHFGVSLSAAPTRTSYRWLVAADPNDRDSAFTVEPRPVEVPVPVWNVAPAGNGVAVQVEVEPVEEEQHAQYGEPQWMKVFKIESEEDLGPADLNRLLLGVAGGIVPDGTEVETEWKLLQSEPGNAEAEEEDADVREDRPAEDVGAIVRRCEFYAYVGPRDAENNEAMPCIDDDAPVPLAEPVEGCADLGDFVGAQNAAVDLIVAAPVACAGDCGGDGSVGIDELITLVRIALGEAAFGTCTAGDADGNGAIAIDELLRAVNAGLGGCPAA